MTSLDLASPPRGSGMPAGAACVPGVSPEIYSHADFERVARMIHEESGILMSEAKRMLVYSRLAPLVRESGCGTFSAFLDTLGQDSARLGRVIASLTTNHTYFNREPHHFEHFGRVVRPILLESLRAGRRARLWSAGCSSGEEVYTLAMTMLGTERGEAQRIANADLRFLASDLAPHAIARAEKAEYEAEALEAIPADLRRHWVQLAGQRGTIAPEVRRLVRFRQLNLLGQWPMRGQFDVIFCRNVMIYFDLPTKEKLIARLAGQLVPGGYLYIGHSERVSGEGEAMLESRGPTVYQRKAA